MSNNNLSSYGINNFGNINPGNLGVLPEEGRVQVVTILLLFFLLLLIIILILFSLSFSSTSFSSSMFITVLIDGCQELEASLASTQERLTKAEEEVKEVGSC